MPESDDPQPAPSESDRLAAAYQLFTRALGEPPERRGALLDGACAGDPALRREVEALLEADAAPSRWDAAWAPGVPGAVAAALDPRVPEVEEASPLPVRVGPYRILGLLGTGGMGRVYEAEQDVPRRTVALKVVRSELVSPELRRRFAVEAEALARLEHPGIARVYAVGLDPAPGEPPWIAMERVAGTSILDHARKAHLSLAARLELLARVAEGVAHAHARGVIHRDLKPSNVLVDVTGQPKIVDFGVARLADERTRLTTLHSRYGRLVGTVAYMSPEQAQGRPEGVDTRSDVYALGVIAYELFAGRPPFDVASEPLPLALRRIAESDPPTLGSVDGALRGDVSIVVAKAMAREPSRRYGTASAFAEDLRRILRHEPILARPPTASYQLRRFVRRHRGLVGGLAATFLSLAVGLLVAVRTAGDRERERVRADGLARERTEAALLAEEAAYRAEVAGAASALRGQDPATVRRRLALAHPASRGWEWRHLDARISNVLSERVLRPGHVEAPALSPDGERLLWLTREGPRRTRWLDVEPDTDPTPVGPRVRWVQWTGRQATAPALVLSESHEGLLVDARTGRTKRFLFPGAVGPAALAPDREWLATSPSAAESPDGVAHITLSSVLDGKVGWDQVVADDARAASLVFLDGRSTLLAGGHDGKLRWLDAGTGKPVRTLDLQQNIVLCLAVAAGGRLIAAGGEDRTIRIVDEVEGRELRALRGHGGRVLHVAFSPDDRTVASISSDGTARLWDLADGTSLAIFQVGDRVFNASIAFDPTGSRLRVTTLGRLLEFPAERDAGAAVLRAHRGRAEGNAYPYVYAVAFHPSGALLASAGWDRTVRLVDPVSGDVLLTLDTPEIPYAIAFDGAGDRLAVACTGGHVRVYSVLDGSVGLVYGDGQAGVPESPLAVSPREPLLLVPDKERNVALVHLETGAVRRRDPGAGPNDHLTALAISPDGARYAFGTREGKAFLVEVGTGRRLATLPGHGGGVNDLAFSPDGRRLASACADGVARVFDGLDGAPVSTLSGHTGPVFAVAFASSGERLFTGGDDGTIRVFDPAGGDDLLALTGHAAYVYDLAVVPRGDDLASASGDNTVRIWSTRRASDRLRIADEHARRRRAADLRIAAVSSAQLPAARFAELAPAAPSLPEDSAAYLTAWIRRQAPRPQMPRPK